MRTAGGVTPPAVLTNPGFLEKPTMASTKVRLTKRTVEALQPGAQPLIAYDTEQPGFYILVMPGGSKSFYLCKRTLVGRQIRLKLGRVTDLSVEQARTEARRLSGMIVLGRDPAQERREARRQEKARQAAPTVGQLAAAWLAAPRAEPWAARTESAYRSWLDCHLLPVLGQMRAHEVVDSDVRRLYRATARKAPSTANRVHAVGSSMYAWALTAEDNSGRRLWPMITSNPFAGAVARDDRAREHHRERFPGLGELESLVAVLAARDDLASLYFLLCLLTGCRPGEPLRAKWSDFDLEAGVWSKPRTSVKQKKSHRTPLNAEAVAVLRKMKELSPFSPTGNLRNHQLDKAWRGVLTEANIAGLRRHDLRHWHASLAAAAGESLVIIGGLLGHASAATTQRYVQLIDAPLRAASAKVGEVIGLAGRRP
jgi:integrase